ncbi:hypothetical protein NT08PM_0076 [Pasteurella multocida subsp. multocida str. 3480]|nr:hypothetical protein NT08PM_0076 [Pasteurella multocida subsp. multocida str. 3480]
MYSVFIKNHPSTCNQKTTFPVTQLQSKNPPLFTSKAGDHILLF